MPVFPVNSAAPPLNGDAKSQKCVHVVEADILDRLFQLLLAEEVLSLLHKATRIVAQYTPVQLE